MAGFAEISTDAVWADRAAQRVWRPAVFAYLDWPSGEVRASTHHKSITTFDESVSPNVDSTWTGVGNVATIEAPRYTKNGALITWKIGLSSLPQQAITDTQEAAAIGRRAMLWMGLFDDAWENPVLNRIFIGHIINAGDFVHRPSDDGGWLTDVTVEISNGRNPRRVVQNNHSPETAQGTDTGWRLLPTVAKQLQWPE